MAEVATGQQLRWQAVRCDTLKWPLSGSLRESTGFLLLWAPSAPPFTGGKLMRRGISVLINAVKDLCQEMGCIYGVGKHGIEALSSFKQLQLHYLSLLLLL